MREYSMLTQDEKSILDQYQVIEVVSEKEKGSVAIVINTEEAKMAVRKQINNNMVDLFRKLSNIHNHNLPEIYHLFSDEESIIIIEEFIEGITLEDMIKNQRQISEQEFLSMMLQLCNALSELHHEDPPIIHRDIKPKNIIYTKDKRLVLIDFDASREFKEDIDKDTRYLGTVEYAPPEQFGHSQTDARSDIYAIGMTMNELVKNGLMESANSHSIQRIIDRCTMFDPDKRYQTIEELEKELRLLQIGRGKKRSIAKLFAALCGVTILVSAIIFFVMVQNKNKYLDITNPVIENQHIDFYKHEKYMDDLKIYIHYNDASEIAYLSLLNFGRISEEHYYRDGNLLIVKKEYLNTLPTAYYELWVGFDKGSPAKLVFEVHDVDEESIYGENRLSHYNKKHYTSNPTDFILLVYDTNGARIQGLYHGKDKIDSDYYQLEDNGAVVIFDKSYMENMEIGAIFDLGIELDNGVVSKLSVQVLERPIQHASLEVYEFFYSIESPKDVLIQITWNDSKEVTHLLPVGDKDPVITDQQYKIEGKILNISREALEGVAPGNYEWAIVYDSGSESMFRITVTK